MSPEVPVAFGTDNHLMGMWCNVAAGAPAPTVAFLLVNAGVIHRVGPHRINVKIARELAALGVPSLRVDLSGLGDSRASGAALDFSQQAVVDLRASMDYVQRAHRIDRFVIFGICSGAHNALATASADPRVAGLVMLDGYAYPTAKTYLVRLWTRARWRGAWGTLRAAFTRVARAVRPKRQRQIRAGIVSVKPPREQFAQTLDELSRRGVRACCIYSGSHLETYNYPAQFTDAFRGRQMLSSVSSEYTPDIDHTATTLMAQRRLIDLVVEWTRRQGWLVAAPSRAGGSS